MSKGPRTIAEAAALLDQRECSAVELAEIFLKRIEERDPELHAYLEMYADSALEEARFADATRANGKAGILTGIPLAVKDNILIQGHRATAGSKILENYEATYDATVIQKLREAGAVFLGKTNLDEFAMGSSTERSAFGVTKNPYDSERVPGGSSGGSAAAVAAGLCLGALGSDTGGSIRQPASFCGVVGMKPTYGRVSRSGLIAMASSLDQIGPLANSVGDSKLIFQTIQGQDPLDATTTAHQDQKRERKQPLRIGVPKEYFGPGLDERVRKVIEQAIRLAKDLGYSIEEITLPSSALALATYYIVMPAEVSSNLARFDGIRYGYSAPDASKLEEVYEYSRAHGFGDEAKRRIILGTFTLSHGYYDAYYLKAQKMRRRIRDDFERVFQSVDCVLGPTTPTAAFRIGEKTDDPLEMYLADIYTVAINLAGLPALSLPAGLVSEGPGKLPVGVQLVTPWHEEELLFDFAEKLETALAFPALAH